ncbi:MAG: DEAD/DEAH box helicase family protein, partial [Phormidesmis sp.]
MNTSTLTTTKIELRPYQQRMVGELYQAIREGDKRLLWIALMGLGKTVLASWVMRDAAATGKRCVFLVPLTVLIDQTLETLEALGVHCTALQGAREVDEAAPVVVASLQTISSRLSRAQSLEEILGHQDIVLADEAHITSYHSRYSELEVWVLGNGGITIGMTATPWRLSKKQWLGQKYDHVIVGPQPPEAIKLGAVVPCRGFRMGEVFDLETLKVKSTGDYSEGDMSAQATTDEALEHVVGEWRRLAEGRPTMMVGSTVVQAEMTSSAFEKAGIKTAVVVGDTPMS